MPAWRRSSAGGRGRRRAVSLGYCRPFEISIVGDGLDALLQRDHLVMAGHYRDGAELQPFRPDFCRRRGTHCLKTINAEIDAAKRAGRQKRGHHQRQYSVLCR
jgi:hypothetical protein